MSGASQPLACCPVLTSQKGDQIFNCYGRKSNRRQLVHYGFCQWCGRLTHSATPPRHGSSWQQNNTRAVRSRPPGRCRDNPVEDLPLKIAAAFPAPPLTDAAAGKPAVLRAKHALFRQLASSEVAAAAGARRAAAAAEGSVAGPPSSSGDDDGAASASIEVLATFEDPVPAAALAAARICCLTAAEASACKSADAARQRISPRNEDAALRCVFCSQEWAAAAAVRTQATAVHPAFRADIGGSMLRRRFLHETLQRKARGLLRGRTPAKHRERIAAAREADCVPAGPTAAEPGREKSEGGGGGGSGENSGSDDDGPPEFACTPEGCAAAYLDGQIKLAAAAVREVARLLSQVEDWE